MNLCIVGAGPKAMAVASKAVALQSLGFAAPRITVVEKSGVAAHWVAGSGLTNGRLPLGTVPDKDVGFPYLSFYWGTGKNDLVNERMQSYSWTRFLVEQHRYAEWIDRGRPAPPHQRWADYLQWVATKVAPHVTQLHGEVVSARFCKDQWHVEYCSDGTPHTVVADGLLLTGPGRSRVPDVDYPRVYSTERFWADAEHLRREVRARFAIVGTGENAASIAATLGTGGGDGHIDVISPVAMSYSRGESFAENHVYTDPFQGNWFQLTPDNRREFINRTDRGVFSVVTKEVLDRLECVDVVPGRMARVRVDKMGQLLLTIEYDQEHEERVYDYLVMATGFDPLGAVEDLLGPDGVQELLRRTGLADLSTAVVEDAIDENLAIAGCLPKLHLPMLAGMNQGPGFPNLSCLGRLSDQILAAYVPLDEQTHPNNETRV